MVNKVTLIGNVGKDPEIRSLGNDSRVAQFSLATSESWRDRNTGERRERTEWHRVSVFNQGLVGIVEKYIKKGSKLYIEGKLETREWTDKDNVKRYTTEVVLRNYGGEIMMLDGRREEGGTGSGSNSSSSGSSKNKSQDSFPENSSRDSVYNDLQDDDIPF